MGEIELKKKAVKKAKPALKVKKVKASSAKGELRGRVSDPALHLHLDQKIWPAERDVLFRPDRLKYVRKLIKPQGCVFCHALKVGIDVESLLVYKTKYSMVVINKFPYNSGHLLVLPLRHCGDLLALNREEYADLMETVRKGLKAIKEIYQPGGVNLGLNEGAAAGAGIPDHLHFHLVPRWAGDLNFFPLIAETKLVVEPAEESWSRFHQWFVDNGDKAL